MERPETDLRKVSALSGWVPMVEVTRGRFVESVHLGAAAVWGPGGLEFVVGSPDLRVFPRSAIKPLQALPLIESGAADRFGLNDRHIALACSSHNGEPVHTELVDRWLSTIGLSEAFLECGSHWPSHPVAAFALAGQGRTPSQLHNNCSGKHTGFLSTALHTGTKLDGYVALDHPIQRHWRDVVAELAEEPLDPADAATDGCAIPTYPISLSAIARAFSRLADPRALGPIRRAAVERVKAAMRAHPFMVAGSERFCTNVIQQTAGEILVKTGAEGVFAGLISSLGLGFALKIADGASRASEIATIALLVHILGRHSLVDKIAPFTTTPVVTRKGLCVGEVRPLKYLNI